MTDAGDDARIGRKWLTRVRRQRRKVLGRKNLTILRNLGQVDGGGVSFNQSHQQGNGLWHCGLTVKSGNRSSARSRLPHHLFLFRPHHSPHVTHHTSHQRPQHTPASDLPSLRVPLPGMLCPQISTWQAPYFL